MIFRIVALVNARLPKLILAPSRVSGISVISQTLLIVTFADTGASTKRDLSDVFHRSVSLLGVGEEVDDHHHKSHT